MYKQYLNDYEKRAEQIRKAARAVEIGKGETIPVDIEKKRDLVAENKNVLQNLKTDDILLLVLIFLLITSDEKDMTLIVILGYLFLCGL